MKDKLLIGDFQFGTRLVARLKRWETGWDESQLKWLRTNRGKLFKGTVTNYDGSAYLKADGIAIALTDDEVIVKNEVK